MSDLIIPFCALSIVMLVACRATRTRIPRIPRILTLRALRGMRNTSNAADTPTLTPSSDVLDLSTSADTQKRAKGWKKLAEGVEKCTEMFLPRRDVCFISFMQSTTLCNILAAFYDVDPETLSPIDVASTTNALNHGSDRCRRECIDRLVRRGALETILPVYEPMWHLAADTLTIANSDEDMRNAFLDFSENPTENQFCASKCKGTKPSVETYIKDVFHPKRPVDHIALSLGFGGLSWIEEGWALMATALVVAKAIDKVDDVRFILTQNPFDTDVGRDTRTRWNGLVIEKKEKANT
ncbi:hypothetical protein K503DRAFT_331813 [Rhizopogon vinicolor AM-OR11-026]|uniref:Uncharacterized protein n=1 Tax=Rhizopogon vinicolor AM-OR11-026 TaxID=1314800 RepID=A0A1B7MTR3_9AGAM|nr:hypothetical protein K503DRAFT_331813 [Rhizopogon vinicolor AM-OR11-026]